MDGLGGRALQKLCTLIHMFSSSIAVFKNGAQKLITMRASDLKKFPSHVLHIGRFPRNLSQIASKMKAQDQNLLSLFLLLVLLLLSAWLRVFELKP